MDTRRRPIRIGLMFAFMASLSLASCVKTAQPGSDTGIAHSGAMDHDRVGGNARGGMGGGM